MFRVRNTVNENVTLS